MSLRFRAWIAFAALAAFLGGLAGQLGAHAHALGEVDLVAHSLIAIDHAPAPGGSAHFDRALELEHPVCQDCLLASLRTDIAVAPPAAPGLDASAPVAGVADAEAPRQRFARRTPARAPPTA
jgi:hypothetical protein